EALELRDHETLGYRSPGDYLADRYGKALSRLPIAVRRETVAAIDSVQTLSTRSLAPVFEVDNKTIHNDRRAIAAGVEGSTPASAESAPSPAEPEIVLANVDLASGEILDDEPVIRDGQSEITKLTGPDSVASPTITGRDGKEYTRPEPQKPRRRAITEVARDAGFDLRKSLRSEEHTSELQS